MIKLPGSLPRFLWIWKIHSLKSILRKFQKFQTIIWKVLNQDQKVISEKLHFGFWERFRYSMNSYESLLWEFEKFLKFWSSRYYCNNCSKIRWYLWVINYDIQYFKTLEHWTWHSYWRNRKFYFSSSVAIRPRHCFCPKLSWDPQIPPDDLTGQRRTKSVPRALSQPTQFGKKF